MVSHPASSSKFCLGRICRQHGPALCSPMGPLNFPTSSGVDTALVDGLVCQQAFICQEVSGVSACFCLATGGWALPLLICTCELISHSHCLEQWVTGKWRENVGPTGMGPRSRGEWRCVSSLGTQHEGRGTDLENAMRASFPEPEALLLTAAGEAETSGVRLQAAEVSPHGVGLTLDPGGLPCTLEVGRQSLTGFCVGT